MSYLPKSKKVSKRVKTVTLTLKPRCYNGINYVLSEDIVKVFGKRWYKRWAEAYGIGNTAIIVPPNDPSHHKPIPQFGIYFHDFERFRNLIDKNEPTFFD